MSFRLKKLATALPSIKCLALPQHFKFAATSQKQGSFRRIYTRKNLILLRTDIICRNFTRLLTQNLNNFDETNKEKESWDVSKLPEEDRFGTLNSKDEYELKTFEEVYEVTNEDNDEANDTVHVHRGRRNTPIWYGNQMKKLLKEHKLKEALSILEVRMLKEDRVQPTEYNYNLLIGGCGRAGYTKKAFRLYNDMKKRGLQPSGVTYTALFNACAESPWPDTDGITRLRKLHSQLQEKETRINLVTHHAMMKAYAKCGDVQTTFKLFHQLLNSGIQLNVDSFVFLFFACASEKESGFVLAIEGWRHMLLRGIQPNAVVYNLLLRIVRDCGIGNFETANHILLKSPTLNQKVITAGTQGKKKRAGRLQVGNKQKLDNLEVSRLDDGENVNISEDLALFLPKQSERSVQHTGHGGSNDIERLISEKNNKLPDSLQSTISSRRSALPNMLSLNPNIEGIISLTVMERPADQLALLGGTTGLLDNMTSNNVKPDCKSLTLLAEIIPRDQEIELLKVVDDLEVKVDVDFYNMLIRKRTKRNDLKAAKDLLADIKHKGLHPNIRTYVALASGCIQEKDGLQLIKNVKATGQMPTQPLYNALISVAHSQRDYNYIIKILKDMEETEVLPNQRTITQLEKVAQFGTTQNRANTKLNGFRGFYTKWLQNIGYENEKHPWSDYRY